jgi:hypothetical protein
MSIVTSQKAWQQVEQHLPVFQIAVSWGLFVVVQCIAVNIKFLTLLFKECAGKFISVYCS